MTLWRRWLETPDKLWVRETFFKIHYGMGMVTAWYVFLMSITGSAIVFRNELSKKFSIEWLVNLHENLSFGATGRFVNGVGASCLTLLCITGAIVWWPGIKYWRRGLTVSWKSHLPRITWDLHSAAGFWFFFFVLVWGVSGIYFCFPELFNIFSLFDPADHVTDQGLFWLSRLHFGRFSRLTEALWALFGLVPATLALTGFFICCHRLIYKKHANPNRVSTVPPAGAGGY